MSSHPSLSRRMFLRTATGGAVAMPLLPSLLPREAAAASLRAPLRFVALATQHGAVWGDRMHPGDHLLTDTTDVGHVVRRGDLVAQPDGADQVLSDVLRADAGRLTPQLLSQLTVLRGLDVPFYLNHHTGGYLGNFGRNDTDFENPGLVPYHPTIDQIMAWSDHFYGSLDGVVARSVHLGHDMSWGYANPSDPASPVQLVPSTWSVQGLFDGLFGSLDDTGPRRRLVVDKVLAHYQNLRDGAFGPGRRLSAGDRDRLDAHMERLYELERRLGAVADCRDVDRPPQDTEGHPGQNAGAPNVDEVYAYYELWNETLAAALVCGATRIATHNCLHQFEWVSGSWHHDVAHQSHVASQQELLVRGHQRFFEHVFLDLCQRLDVPDIDGETVLHNSMVMWTQESGPVPHDPISMPVVMAGSAGGALRSGQYVDYRHRESDAFGHQHDTPIHAEQRPGLLYGHFLAHLLDTAGVPRSTWEIAHNPGFGIHINDNPTAWPTYVEDLAADPLPFLAP